MAKETFTYEILAIDQSGTSEITTVKSMTMGLSYSEKLWKKPTAKTSSIEDKGLGITLQVTKAGEVDDETEAAFLLKAKSSNIDKADEFRENLLHHLKDKLGFTNIRVLKDSVSEQIAKNIYLNVTEAESALRSTLSKQFLQLHGLNWWDAVAGKKLATEVAKRKNSDNSLAAYLDNDIMFTSFEELLNLAEKAALNNTINQQLKELEAIKTAVSFNNVFGQEDQQKVEKLTKSLISALEKLDGSPAKAATKKATAKKATPKKTTAKAKPAAKKATPKPAPQPKVEKAPEPAIEAPIPVQKEEAAAPVAEAIPESPKPEPKPEPTPPKREEPDLSDDAFMMITENKLLEELQALESVQSGEINIKSFVKEVLARKGYMSGPAYGLAESMKEKGLVNIYETKDDKGFMIKVIKSN